MLNLNNRSEIQTLLAAETLTQPDDRPAIIYISIGNDPVTVTRAEFKAAAEAAATGMHAAGIGRGDLILIAHTQNLEGIYLFWGAMLIGAIPSMFSPLTEKLDPAVYARNMAELVELSDVKAIFTTAENKPILEGIAGCPIYSNIHGPDGGGTETTPYARGDLRVAPSHAIKFPPPAPDAIAFLQHSSGTTGLQKGVALSHEAVLNQLAAYADALSLTEEDVIVSWLPLYHDMGLIAGFMQPLVQGVPLVLMSPFEWVRSPGMLLRAISEYKGTLCWLPNFAYNHMARRVRKGDIVDVDLGSMRAFVNCSEPVHLSSHALFLKRFEAFGVKPEMLSVSYAMAENTFAVTQTAPGQPPRLDWIDQQALIEKKQANPIDPADPKAAAQVSCGRAIQNTEVAAINPGGEMLLDRQVGELIVRSDCMLTEYYQREDLDPFDAEGWYRTGDMGYLADGEVYVIGRAKDLIINAGKNVYPQDLEAVANTVEGVKAGRAVAFGVYDEREGTEIIALVAETEVSDFEHRKQIARNIRQAVANQTTVALAYVEVVDRKWLLKTSSGKIARAANRDKWLAEKKR